MSGGPVISESPASDGGPNTVLIFVGARTGALISGTTEPDLDGAADVASEDEAFARGFLDVLAGADIDTVDSLGMATPASLSLLSRPLRAAVATVEAANSESFDPAHARANHRPPAMPFISRCAIRHGRTFDCLPFRSKGMTGAKPVPIFGGLVDE